MIYIKFRRLFIYIYIYIYIIFFFFFLIFNLQVFEQQDAVEYYRKILKAVGTRTSQVFHINSVCFDLSEIKQRTVNKFVIIILTDMQ